MKPNSAKRLAAEASKKVSPLTFIESRMRELDRADVESYAVQFVMLQVRQRKRAKTRVVERQSEGLPAGWTHTNIAGGGWLTDPEGRQVEDPEYALVHENRRRREKAAEDLIRSMRENIELDLSAELLMSRWAVADGVEISWGEATVREHQERYEMYKANVVADAEGAARHLAAIEMIQAAGVHKLNDLGHGDR